MTPGLVVGHKLEEDNDNENNNNKFETSTGRSLIKPKMLMVVREIILLIIVIRTVKNPFKSARLFLAALEIG